MKLNCLLLICLQQCVHGFLLRSEKYRRLQSTLSHSVTDYLARLQDLGKFRFVVVGPGAILEAVGSFSNLRYSESPKSGEKLATVSVESSCFECHLKLHEIKTASHVVVEKLKKKLFVIRFCGGNSQTFLSAILLQEDKIDDFMNLVLKYGDSVEFQ